MLQNLYIKNYVIIKEININFNKGFTTITGETGAGKSILLGALSLIMGKRVDTSVMLNKEKKCIIEGHFNISEYNLKSFFENNELDYDDNTIIRREINTNGKSRAFINDTPVNINTLKNLSSKLIDIHSQNNNLLLKDKDFYFLTIDSFANTQNEVNSYTNYYNKYKKLLKQKQETEQTLEKQKQETDYLQFRFDQINNANLEETEQETLETEYKKLSNAEEIKENLTKVYYLLYENDENIISQLKYVSSIFENIKKLGINEDYAERINSVIIELSDIASDTEILNNSIELDNFKLEEINNRLNEIYNLQQKFGVQSIKELLDIKTQIENKLLSISTNDNKLSEITAEITKTEKQLHKLAENINKQRINASKKLQNEIKKILQNLGIKDADFIINIQQTEELNKYGKNKIEFLFSANKNIEPQELSKTASGGELSRTMLALKSILAKKSNLPSIIFDEIDTGVSGEIASKMAEIMKDLSTNTQVISITHLPQVAALSDYHIVVYKNEKETSSEIKLLNKDQRINEIAKMLSGKNITEAAIKNAKDLLKF